jgi:hypothetical protein
MRVLFLLAVSPITAVWYGFAFSIMWGWFIVPVFHVTPLRIPYAIGIAYVVQFLAHQTLKPEDQPEPEQVLIMALVKPLVLLTAGWIVTWFI